jgi:hypothetical protein
MMFHSVSELERTEIGHSGMYEGGLEAAIRYVETKQKDDESYISQSFEGSLPYPSGLWKGLNSFSIIVNFHQMK